MSVYFYNQSQDYNLFNQSQDEMLQNAFALVVVFCAMRHISRMRAMMHDKTRFASLRINYTQYEDFIINHNRPSIVLEALSIMAEVAAITLRHYNGFDINLAPMMLLEMLENKAVNKLYYSVIPQLEAAIS
jgi:hypothetical protein